MPTSTSRTRWPKRQFRPVRLRLRAGEDGARLVVIADTHSNPHPRSHALIEALRPDRILHAGDVGDPHLLTPFEAIAPVVAVRGNIDARKPLPDDIVLEIGDAQGSFLRLLLLHIAVNGPRLRADAARFAEQESAQLVVCGHSHVPFIGKDKGVFVFNPGSIGPRRFSLPIVFGVIDARRSGISMHHVSCESGERWLPP